MSGRGDNNKNGTSGQGARNQSNQPFISDGQEQQASNHRKQPTGGKRSEDQQRSIDPDAHRDQGHLDEPPKKKK